MAIFVDTPGVYIEEVTGPGVIAGVGTSTAAFIGPAKRGPKEPLRVSSFDDFLSTYAAPDPAGVLDPYIVSPRVFFMAHAVRGFFENGGRQAFILRASTGSAKSWTFLNQATPADPVFRLEALDEGAAGNGVSVVVEPASLTGPNGRLAVRESSLVTKVTGQVARVDHPERFRIGDFVTKSGKKEDQGRARILEINGSDLTLDGAIVAKDDTLRIANFVRSQQTTLRLASTESLFRGSVVTITARNADDTADQNDRAIVELVAGDFVTFAADPSSTKVFCLAPDATEPTKLVSVELTLKISNGSKTEELSGLSLHSAHPNNVLRAVPSELVRALPPIEPPIGAGVLAFLINATPAIQDGVDDKPGALTALHYSQALKQLEKVDDVNLVCIPDAAAHGEWRTIQTDMLNHCLKLQDRFALLDSRPNLPPKDTPSPDPNAPRSVEEQRKSLDSERGLGALYYPWLEVRDPKSTTIPPRTMFIPPCGHMAGVYARTDQERGVHKAPANTDVRGVLGLERRLSDGEQGPLNLQGVNVLRIFPNSNSVIVWGARTTVRKDITDWTYVPVRRLLLFIEESIEEGIRFAVFEPNNLALWQKLKRTISEFLTRVWRDGALFGASPDKAFSVRIDEALNPPSERALGKLLIEIGVAAVRPAEFIIVRIGLRDDGASFDER